jgi:hypothetical protein
MLLPLWHRLWNGNRVVPRRKCLRGKRQVSYRPSLEPLEARELPALPGSGLIAPAVPAPASMSYQNASQLPGVAR